MYVARPDLSIAVWRKSSYSTNGGGCIEVAEQFPGALPVRDSKAPRRTPIVVPRGAWVAFVNALRTDMSA